MRTMSLFLISAALCFVEGAVSAQTATEGPLAASSNGADANPHKLPVAKSPPVRPHRRQARAAAGRDLPAEGNKAARPIARRDPTGVSDPVDFGMKWNGSNDDARGTRVQNYGGGAIGSGAEVGMKLHF